MENSFWKLELSTTLVSSIFASLKRVFYLDLQQFAFKHQAQIFSQGFFTFATWRLAVWNGSHLNANPDGSVRPVFHFNRMVAKRSVFCCVHTPLVPSECSRNNEIRYVSLRYGRSGKRPQLATVMLCHVLMHVLSIFKNIPISWSLFRISNYTKAMKLFSLSFHPFKQ